MRSLAGNLRIVWRGGALCAGAVALLAVLLTVCAGTTTPAGAAGEYISVPGDADTIHGGRAFLPPTHGPVGPLII